MMTRKSFTMKNAWLGAALALFGVIGLVGCGDSADCSKCPGDQQETCENFYDECRKEGSSDDCQKATDAMCALLEAGFELDEDDE